MFLIYFSVMIYSEKSEKLRLISNYIERVDQSANLRELIDELSRERRYSYQYTIKKAGYDEVMQHRLRTDSIIQLLQKSQDPALVDFTKYTFLENLHDIRKAIDTAKTSTNAMVQFYTDVIMRLNTLNSTISSNTFLKPVYQDLTSQRILSEMITYLGIIRTDIFNALYTKDYNTNMIPDAFRLYKVYNSYETEFLLKASSSSVQSYNNEKKLTEYGTTLVYLDKLFATFKFSNRYSADQWWDECTKSMSVLRKQQRSLWESVDARMKEIYKDERNFKNATVIFLLVSVLLVISFVAYAINDITKLLRQLKVAARKISSGGTGLNLKDMPRGVIGNLAKSIARIDKNNLLLAQAANQIGKGNFDVIVKPRSDEDLLGISINKMKDGLREFNSQKDRIQKETEELVYKRDEFFSIASHELKTPVTSLKAYMQLLLMDASASGNQEQENMLSRMDKQIVKLSSLINDLLDTSRLQNGNLIYYKEDFHIKELVTEIIEQTQFIAPEHVFTFKSNTDAMVNADRERIGQVITNFLTNAVKYASNSNKINVALNRTDGKVVCSVQDFGNGIIPEEHDKVFERFYRISGNNLNTFPGLGLGLFICKEIIEKHNGKIWVESEKGMGCTFYFEFPVSDEPS